MKPLASLILLFFSLTTSTHSVSAHMSTPSLRAKGYWHQEWSEENGEKIATVHLLPVHCFVRGLDRRKYWRLVHAVKTVYPIAKLAREKMSELEGELAKLETKKEQKAYIKSVYKDLLEEYTPVLKKMTMTQGRVLIRLIDRETEYTAYEVLHDFRGGFVASFWQGIGRLFGQNLKSEYGSSNEDKIIEQIIIYYEAGLI